MKRIIMVLLVLFSVIIISCTQANIPVKQDTTMEKESNEILEIGYEMQNGKMMMVDAKTKTQNAMTKDAILNDGTKVMMNGKMMKKDGSTSMLKEGESIWMDGEFMEAEPMEKETMMTEFKGKVLAGTKTPYLDFNKADYDNALKANKIVLLNFYASWCPLCKAEQPEVFAAFNEMENGNVIGFRVNYKDSDTDADEEALAKQFGVAYQHTKVILKNGERAGKFPDSWDKQRYLDEIIKVQ